MRERIRNIAILLAVLAAPAVHGADPSTPPGAKRGESVLDLAGEETTLRTAGNASFRAYVVGPKQAPRGILLIPASVGLTKEARSAADRFAKLGYRVAVVDIAGGREVTITPRAGGPKQVFDQNDANAKYRAGLEALREPGRRLAVMGWCFGAKQALEASLAAADLVTATVMYGGAPTVDPKRLETLKSSVLVLQPEGDRNDRAERMRTESAMRQAGVEFVRQPADAPGGCGNENADTPLPDSRAAREFLDRQLGQSRSLAPRLEQ